LGFGEFPTIFNLIMEKEAKGAMVRTERYLSSGLQSYLEVAEKIHNGMWIFLFNDTPLTYLQSAVGGGTMLCKSLTVMGMPL
jgi:hypothetical protein